MRSPFVLLSAAVMTLLAAAGSCTSATGPTFPLGAQTIPTSFTDLSVASLPGTCSGQTFYEGSSALCPAGLTYFLCDGNSYTEFDCANPGSGWSLETLSEEDRTATAPTCSGTSAASRSGTVYVEGNVGAPGENAVLAFQYCEAGLPSSLSARYLTGGSGAADLNDTGVLDADQQVIVNADQTLLYAVNQGSDTIAAFHVASDGSLTAVAGSPFPSQGPAPASLGLSGSILVVANKATDGIRNFANVAPNYATFVIQSDGSLQPTGSKYVLPVGSSPTQAFVAPGGGLVFATEESGVFRGLQLSPEGELRLAPGSPVPLPSSLFVGEVRPQPVWPAGLSASAKASVLYTGVPNNDSIAALDFTSEGALTVIGGERDRNAFLPCWSVVNADDTRLYFANAGSDNLSVWDIATDPRHPQLIQTFELSGGGNPWGLHLDPTGQLLFAITPRQIHQVPEGQGQLLHGLQLASDGTIADVLPGSPVTLPVAADTNPFGVAVVAAR